MRVERIVLDLLVLDPFRNIRILSPAAFLEVIAGVGRISEA
jgi:hypothetical protein